MRKLQKIVNSDGYFMKKHVQRKTGCEIHNTNTNSDDFLLNNRNEIKNKVVSGRSRPHHHAYKRYWIVYTAFCVPPQRTKGLQSGVDIFSFSSSPPPPPSQSSQIRFPSRSIYYSFLLPSPLTVPHPDGAVRTGRCQAVPPGFHRGYGSIMSLGGGGSKMGKLWKKKKPKINTRVDNNNFWGRILAKRVKLEIN